jgi:hypothetical protein
MVPNHDYFYRRHFLKHFIVVLVTPNFVRRKTSILNRARLTGAFPVRSFFVNYVQRYPEMSMLT